MCIVYQAWDTRQERFVAIKRLEPPLNEDPRTRARFDREGRALAMLDHPNIVALLDRGSSENDDYLVFEYVEGRSLKELIREGHISIEAFGLLVGQVAEGLASAHQAGIVHRDVKPQNILIDRMGHAKVSDFGIATGPDWTRVTRAGAVIGSARYMSPEQIRSKPVDARSDIYSLGIVMYEMLTGHTPFDGQSMPEIARLHLQATPPPLTDARTKMPPGLDELVMRCLEKDADDRFDSMEEVLGALVGLGLYMMREEVEETASHKWPLRRGSAEERKPRRPFADTTRDTDAPASAPRTSGGRESGGRESSGRSSASGSSGAHSSDARASEGDDGDRRWVRERARETARKRRRAKRRRLMAIAAVVVLLVVLISVLATRGGGKAPDVLNLTLEEATSKAGGAGLELVINEVPSFDQAGIVLGQDPDPGIAPLDGKLVVSIGREPIPVQINTLEDFDPMGNDQAENHNQVGNLQDANYETTWSTELYKSPTFAGLTNKTGVGLVFRLDEGATMVKIVSPVTGWEGQVLDVLADGSTIPIATLGAQQVVTWSEPLDAGRIWFTKLTAIPGTDRNGVVIGEIEFYR
jgi:serine/threonine protein kinase